MRNLEKIEMYVDEYKKGYIIYRNGTLYRTVKRVGRGRGKKGHKVVKLDSPSIMRMKLGDSNGRYYRVGLNGTTAYEHIVIYAIHHGVSELSKYEAIDHLNNNKLDNRIENLEGVSTEENNKRIIEDGLLPCQKGENNGASIHKEEEILEIRKLYKSKKYTQYEIADMFGMTQGTVSSIVNRKMWSHI